MFELSQNRIGKESVQKLPREFKFVMLGQSGVIPSRAASQIVSPQLKAKFNVGSVWICFIVF